MKRIGIIIASIAVLGVVYGLFMYEPNEKVNVHEEKVVKSVPLPIPPLLEDLNDAENIADYELSAQKSSKVFINGIESETYGYNGDYLGPVIRVRRGEEVNVKIKNDLGDEETTVHWHGLEVDADADGGPHQAIQAGETFTTQFTVNQSAATLWYHPHPLHKTGEQVYKGLAGLLIIEDEVSDELDIPNSYGVNDFPLVIQDRDLQETGKLTYKATNMDIMHGAQGDTPLVNGANNAHLEVPQGKVRLRLLNGSNARVNQLELSNQTSFQQIASDGGFLERPVQMNKLVLGAAERAEVIIDFSAYETGEEIELWDDNVRIMKFVIGAQAKEEFNIPEQLTVIDKIDPSTVSITREFVLQGHGKAVNINGKQMDMNHINEQIKQHDTEIWEVSNPQGMMGMEHPFHVHGVQFQVLERNGESPSKNEQGRKDTVLLFPGEEVKLIATFNYQGTFMYHCHILEHEDTGMMGQFNVE